MFNIQTQENLLLSSGWEKIGYKFLDPEFNKSFFLPEAYELYCLTLLLNNNWKIIKEYCQIRDIKRIIDRYQSPYTKIIYNFNDIIKVVENNFIEGDLFPLKCTNMTIRINKLLGFNFNNNSFKTLFYLNDIKEIIYKLVL